MRLKFPSEWRIKTPKSSLTNTENIPHEAIQDLVGLIRQISTQGDLKFFLEHFKKYFCLSNGNPYYPSSSAGWAESDLINEMNLSSVNAPRFLEAFFNACESLREKPNDYYAPDYNLVNEVCENNNIGYYIEPPYLKIKNEKLISIPVDNKPTSIEARGLEILQSSLKRADELLIEGRGREAVQETLWLLETITTAFRGLETETTSIEGKYFNTIVKDLKNAHSGTSLNRILEWANNIHGYLSSPTGGAVRHGLDLKEGLELSINEARLFCNLIRSFLSFLLVEHERLMSNKNKI